MPTAAKLQLFKAEILPAYLTYCHLTFGISAERVIRENSNVLRRGVCARAVFRDEKLPNKAKLTTLYERRRASRYSMFDVQSEAWQVPSERQGFVLSE